MAFSLLSPSSFLKLPIVSGGDGGGSRTKFDQEKTAVLYGGTLCQQITCSKRSLGQCEMIMYY